MVIFFNLSPTSSHLHPLQVENCGSNSRLVVDEGDNGRFRTERVNSDADMHSVLCVFIKTTNKDEQLVDGYYSGEVQQII